MKLHDAKTEWSPSLLRDKGQITCRVNGGLFSKRLGQADSYPDQADSYPDQTDSYPDQADSYPDC